MGCKKGLILAMFTSLGKNEISLLILFSVVFILGLSGMILKRKNVLLTLLCVEVMYLGVITHSICVSGIINAGHNVGLLILVSAACESAVGLGILIVLNKYGRSISYEKLETLKG